jgi:hypothetical protein
MDPRGECDLIGAALLLTVNELLSAIMSVSLGGVEADRRRNVRRGDGEDEPVETDFTDDLALSPLSWSLDWLAVRSAAVWWSKSVESKEADADAPSPPPLPRLMWNSDVPICGSSQSTPASSSTINSSSSGTSSSSATEELEAVRA